MLEVGVEPSSSRFSPTDERWQSQVAEFTADLGRETGSVTQRARAANDPNEKTKGALTDLVVQLGSAGVFGSMVALAKAWLGRDASRAIKLTWFENGNLQSLDLKGTNIDEAELARLHALVQTAAPG